MTLFISLAQTPLGLPPGRTTRKNIDTTTLSGERATRGREQHPKLSGSPALRSLAKVAKPCLHLKTSELL